MSPRKCASQQNSDALLTRGQYSQISGKSWLDQSQLQALIAFEPMADMYGLFVYIYLASRQAEAMTEQLL